MRWCSELVTDYLRDPVGQDIHHKFQLGTKNTDGSYSITDKKVLLPDNMFKLDGVFNEDYKLIEDLSYQGQYIFFADSKVPQKVFIDYTSLPMDADGFPFIKRGYESAAYYYCIYKMYEEDATRIPPKIAQWRWLEIQRDKDWEIEAASRSWDDITDNDIRDIHNYLVSDAYAMFVRRNDTIQNKNALGRTSSID